MKHKIFIYLSFSLSVILFACKKDNSTVLQKEIHTEGQTSAERSTGATQISGVGFYASPGECDYESQGAVYAILTGVYMKLPFASKLRSRIDLETQMTSIWKVSCFDIVFKVYLSTNTSKNTCTTTSYNRVLTTSKDLCT